MHRVPLASRNTWSFVSSGKPHGWRKRPLDTASQAVKDAPSVPTLSRRFLGLCYGVQTRSLASCLRHQPRQEPRALTRMRGSVRGDWRKPVPYRDVGWSCASVPEASGKEPRSRSGQRMSERILRLRLRGLAWHIVRLRSCGEGPKSAERSLPFRTRAGPIGWPSMFNRLCKYCKQQNAMQQIAMWTRILCGDQ